MTLRLNDEQYEFILECSKLLGVSPSDYIRMSVNAGMVSIKELQKKEGEVGTNENVKTDSNNIV
jgi:hypothetical protein